MEAKTLKLIELQKTAFGQAHIKEALRTLDGKSVFFSPPVERSYHIGLVLPYFVHHLCPKNPYEGIKEKK